MADAALIARVKKALRVTADFDDEIGRLIDAAKVDLGLSGVAAAKLNPDPEDLDPLVELALVLYCKAEFGLDNPDRERYMASFRSVEEHLALASEYQESAS